MSNIVIKYVSDDPVQVKKIFDTLLVWYSGNVDAVLTALKNNQIAVDNAIEWVGEMDNKIQIVKDFIAGEDLKIGNIRRYNNEMYVVLQDHTSQSNWAPDITPALFLHKPAPTQGNVYPDWVQPTGAHDVYSAGDRVVHNSQDWESITDNNSWEPGVYGWITI